VEENHIDVNKPSDQPGVPAAHDDGTAIVKPTTEDHVARAERFHQLHDAPRPFRLVNAWDRFSTRVFILAGAPAVGTSSFAVALAHGYQDGQRIPWAVARDVVADLVDAAGDVPVTADIEAGQGPAPSDVTTAVDDVITAGAVGVNIEDSLPEARGELFTIEDQCGRLRAARAAAERRSLPLFINARCDVYFGARLAETERPQQLIERATAYAEAGASGVFVPGLADLDVLARLCDTVGVPVNVMVRPGLPSVEALAGVGVRRISQGGASFLLAAGYLERMTRTFLEGPYETAGGDVVPAMHLVRKLVTRP
jgi:2-methylisocitrate lyase-like PEP mutase family enzyme